MNEGTDPLGLRQVLQATREQLHKLRSKERALEITQGDLEKAKAIYAWMNEEDSHD